MFDHLILKFAQRISSLTRLMRENGSVSLAFVVTMLVLNCGMLIAGVVMYALGDPGLIKAAGQAAVVIGPPMTAAAALLGWMRKPVLS